MKPWQITLLVLLSLIIVVVLFMSFKKKPTIQATVNKTITEVNPDAILHLGDQGQIIKLLQSAVNEKLKQYNLYGELSVSGIFDNQTEEAINRLTQGLLSSSQNNISFNNIKYRANW